jgi:hypothetical protein
MKQLWLLFIASLFWNSALSEETSQVTANELAAQVLSEGVSSLDPAAVMAWAGMPHRASVGETVVLTISIENGRETEPFILESLDIGGDFGKGFEVVSINPKPTAVDTMLNTLTLEYPINIPPGELVDFELKLRAMASGVFIGEVDLWEGDKVLTRYAQCKVVK